MSTQMKIKRFVGLVSLGVALSYPAAGQKPLPPERVVQTIVYQVGFPRPEAHIVEVEVRLPATADPLTVFLPVWTPGSYLVREYARQLLDITARDESGNPLRVEKTAKNRWAVETKGASHVVVRYRLFAHELSVRTNFVDASFALLNGAATFLTLPGELDRPHEVHFELPSGWARVSTQLRALDPAGRVFRAASYDELVDSPFHLGNPTVYEAKVDGVPHRLVNEADGGVWDGPTSIADIARIAGAHRRLWGSFPYPDYTFLNLLTETDGGIEHKGSTVLMASRFATRTRTGYVGWLSLASHELFHAWNGKRLRPVELGPFDYEREVHSRGLWVVEGVTSYYDDLLVRRSGITSDQEYLKLLSKAITKLETSPGRKVQPLEEASFDAWIKHYRPDESDINTRMSYYTKGAVVAFLLDMEIRRATAGARSLDDAMRRAYQRWSGDHGYTVAEWRALLSEVAGTDLSAFFHGALDTTADLNYQPALDWLGLKLVADEDEAPDEDEPPAGWLGGTVEDEAGLLWVTEVPHGTPAHAAGLNVDDELLAVGGFRVTPGTFEGRLAAYRPGETVEILVTRRDRLVTLSATLGTKPNPAWQLEADPDATSEQVRRRVAWLSGS